MEDLFLTFAKKASAFNSWFENAEEDLTDPVRCNSLEEIRALREAHEAFRSSLSSAQADFNQLAELDKQIKSYQVVSNPYTWFTMEALEETWRNLQKIIKVSRRLSRGEGGVGGWRRPPAVTPSARVQERELELQKEQRRQEENDKLRQEFAQHANAFHQWLQETRWEKQPASLSSRAGCNAFSTGPLHTTTRTQPCCTASSEGAAAVHDCRDPLLK